MGKASQATVINNRTVTKSLMVTDTEIRIPMDIKTTDMVNNLTGQDMDKTPMDPDMDTNNLMVMVTDMVTNPTVTDIVNLATVMDMVNNLTDQVMDTILMDPVITTKDTDTSTMTSISTIPTKRSDTTRKSKTTTATKS